MAPVERRRESWERPTERSDIPAHIGVYVGDYPYWPFIQCVKRPKRQELTEDVNVLKDSMIRSLSREASKEIRRKISPPEGKSQSQGAFI